jgi:hypothetical protein
MILVGLKRAQAGEGVEEGLHDLFIFAADSLPPRRGVLGSSPGPVCRQSLSDQRVEGSC